MAKERRKAFWTWLTPLPFLAFAAVTLAEAAAFGAAGLTYHGRLVRPNGLPVEEPVVKFKFQIRTPGNENCLLFEEIHLRDMTGSQGVFAITLNGGTPLSVNTEPFTLDRIFQNRGTFTFGTGKCLMGNAYSPGLADGRKLIVEFNDGTFADWEALPVQEIQQVPTAIESMSVGGYGRDSLLRVHDGAGLPASIPALTNLQYDALTRLMAGTSPLYLTSSSVLDGANLAAGSIDETKLASGISAAKIAGDIPGRATGFTGALTGDVTGTQGATVVARIQGRNVDTSMPLAGQVLKWDDVDGRWEPSADAGLTTESDPTVPASLKDGVDWSEISTKPPAFPPSAHGHYYSDLQNQAGAYLSYKPNDAACATGEVLKWTAAGRWECAVDATGAGESTTVSNVGTAGVGVYKQLSGTEIQLKKLNAASGALTVADDAVSGKIDIGVNAELGGIAGLSGNGFVKRTGAGAYSAMSQLSLTTDVTGTLPVANGGTGAATAQAALNHLLPSQSSQSGKVLQTDGTNASWVSPAGGTITALTGDVTAAGTGSVAATIANNAVNSAKIADGSVGVADLSFAGSMATNTGLVVRNGTQLYNMTCSGNQTLIWTVANGWSCSNVTLSESDPKVGANTTNSLSKWNGSALVASNVHDNGTNVGIGTASPGQKLDVAGAVRASGELMSTGSNQARYISGNYGVIHRNDGTNYYILTTASGDQYGSWSTLRPLTVNVSTGDVNLAGSAVIAKHGGNVGIGTASPGSKLEVAGTVHATNGGFKFPDGSVQTTAAGGASAQGTSCKAILDSGNSTGSGIYIIDPDGAGGTATFRAYCDMDTQGGGWTLVATFAHITVSTNLHSESLGPAEPADGFTRINVNARTVNFTQVRESIWLNAGTRVSKTYTLGAAQTLQTAILGRQADGETGQNHLLDLYMGPSEALLSPGACPSFTQKAIQLGTSGIYMGWESYGNCSYGNGYYGISSSTPTFSDSYFLGGSAQTVYRAWLWIR